METAIDNYLRNSTWSLIMKQKTPCMYLKRSSLIRHSLASMIRLSTNIFDFVIGDRNAYDRNASQRNTWNRNAFLEIPLICRSESVFT